MTTNRSRVTTLFRFAALAALLLAGLAFGPLTAARAAGSTLAQAPGDELKTTYQAGQKYTLRLFYTDPSGDEIQKSKALFIDEAPSGRVSIPATNIVGDDTTKGVVIEWAINGFEQGGHRASFEVNSLTGKVRYPSGTEPYAFVVEAIGSKIITMLIGAGVGLLAVPFLVYILTRTMNRRGDPSYAARVGLLFGILACCALFIYLFLSIFGPLVYAILAVGAVAGLVLLINRR